MDRRQWLVAVASSALAAPARAAQIDAVVGQGGHATLQAALDAAPAASPRPWRILVKKGAWVEKLTVSKPNIHLIGESRRATIISYGAFSGQTAPDGQPWGTRRSATLTIQAPDFSAKNLTIQNSFDVANQRLDGGTAFQAVALALTQGADRAQFDRVDVLGFQDTLLADAGRSAFRNATITGTVDFIFGAGVAWFHSCEIVSRWRQMPGEGRLGYIAAPSTLVSSPYGLVFETCRLAREKGVPMASVALGRPWRPTTTFPDGRYGNPAAVGQAVFLRCWMDDHIDPRGWDPMSYNAKDGSRVALDPRDARFFEYASQGPGGAGPGRRLLKAKAAAEFGRDSVLSGWRPF